MMPDAELYLDLMDELYDAYAQESWLSFTSALQGLFKEIARLYHGNEFERFIDRRTNKISEKSALDHMLAKRGVSRGFVMKFEEFWQKANSFRHEPLGTAKLDRETAKSYCVLYNDMLSYISIEKPSLKTGRVILLVRLVVDEKNQLEHRIKHLMTMNPKVAMDAREQILDYAKAKVLCPIIYSASSTDDLKASMKRTIERMERMDALECIRFIRGLVVSEESRPNDVSERIKKAGFMRFEDCIDEFRQKYSLNWLETKLQES